MQGRWKTKRGVVEISKMTKDHIESCVNMLLSFKSTKENIEKITEFENELLTRQYQESLINEEGIYE